MDRVKAPACLTCLFWQVGRRLSAESPEHADWRPCRNPAPGLRRVGRMEMSARSRLMLMAPDARCDGWAPQVGGGGVRRRWLPLLSVACYGAALALTGHAVVWPILRGEPGHWNRYPFIVFTLAAGVVCWANERPRDTDHVLSRAAFVVAVAMFLAVLREVGQP